MVNSMVIRLFYYTLCRADQGHRTLLGADMTHTRTQSQTRTHHFHLKNQKMERSAQTHAEGFQLSATNVKIDWRKPFRLADTLLTKMCWERLKPLNQSFTGLDCHSSFNPIKRKLCLTPCAGLSTSGWLRSHKPQCPEWLTANCLLGLLFALYLV